ncbi:hypothetical protein J6590_093553 [Homalodisca vitripennis]|nr:hypothetical protein J6590_093553 [Homalodisca vitripennis]
MISNSPWMLDSLILPEIIDIIFRRELKSITMPYTPCPYRWTAALHPLRVLVVCDRDALDHVVHGGAAPAVPPSATLQFTYYGPNTDQFIINLGFDVLGST